ncbi:hypothetical protein C1H46_040540 [Malus baccata]|uniref:Uncharacterized protein n=1 Tax=Malus baccata TaxID=106549 RepID=A0A540KI90_MALBA|nr:hypothetical protein C1H46_040540 [Malus baccata]
MMISSFVQTKLTQNTHFLQIAFTLFWDFINRYHFLLQQFIGRVATTQIMPWGSNMNQACTLNMQGPKRVADMQNLTKSVAAGLTLVPFSGLHEQQSYSSLWLQGQLRKELFHPCQLNQSHLD